MISAIQGKSIFGPSVEESIYSTAELNTESKQTKNFSIHKAGSKASSGQGFIRNVEYQHQPLWNQSQQVSSVEKEHLQDSTRVKRGDSISKQQLYQVESPSSRASIEN